MAFKFSMSAAKAKAEEEAREREEKLALEQVMADFGEEHGAESSILGEEERAHDDDVFVPTGSKRHFTGRQRTLKSGPGTLEAEAHHGHAWPGAPGWLPPAMQAGPPAPEERPQAENVYTTLVAKASNLPPAFEPQHVEALFADCSSLKITKIERIPPQGPGFQGRPSATMKVVFDKDALARELDEVMMKLNGRKYLGRGYYLHLDRFLGGKFIETAQPKEPFGAVWKAPEAPKGFAPPPDLGGGNRDGEREDRDRLVVTANYPPDLATLRLIHQTIEGVILGGVEFEAALMNDLQVQEEERFAWLYDQTHPLNRYYRWRLHQLICGNGNSEIFEDQGVWHGPAEALADEFVDDMGTFDIDSPVSESDEEEDIVQHKPLPSGDSYPARIDSGHGILRPRSRAMLLWILTNLPPGPIVADDLAAISVFAVQHSAQGLDEVVHILLSNIIQPFQLTDTNTRTPIGDAEGKDDIRRPDLRQVTLNALRIVHDVLFASSKEAGVNYKYRNAIGTQLVERKVIEHLDRLPGQLALGRMTEKAYRDEVNVILDLWEHESFFDKATMERLDDVFNARERQKEQEEQDRRVEDKRKRKVGP
jgi:U2-associated protein SR140